MRDSSNLEDYTFYLYNYYCAFYRCIFFVIFFKIENKITYIVHIMKTYMQMMNVVEIYPNRCMP